MKGQQERRFQVSLAHQSGFQFGITASEDGLLHGEPFTSDEPDPVGASSGPSTPALLGAAVSHCLSASLLEVLQRAHLDLVDFKAEADITVIENAEGLPRINLIEVTLFPTLAEPHARAARCEDIFQRYCTVSASVKRGIDVRVLVDWNYTEPTPSR